jgi:hypothetical protein
MQTIKLTDKLLIRHVWKPVISKKVSIFEEYRRQVMLYRLGSARGGYSAGIDIEGG